MRNSHFGHRSSGNTPLIMSPDLLVSIILCTRDRPEALRDTLQVLGRLRVRSAWHIELLVIDNGIIEGTEAVVRGAGLQNMAIRSLKESRPGKSNALNAGLL